MSFHHIEHPHPHRPAADLSDFYVITVISNSVRYQRRYELYHRFAEMVRSAGVKLVTVEQAFGERPFMVTQANDLMDVQVRSCEELWLKENMINLGIARARQHGATKIAWIDADCAPLQPPRRWFEETWHALQHYEFVQMWATMINVDEEQNAIGCPQNSFMYTHLAYGASDPEGPKTEYHRGFGAPGLAWAANVDALDKVGGLIDFCILGAADWYMSCGLVGALGDAFRRHANSSPAFIERLMQWQTLAERHIKRDVGYVPGTVWHDWHGHKRNRQYQTRNNILLRANYNPNTDLKYDSFGLLQLETWEPRQIRLRDDIRQYFRQRNEDSLSR